MVNKKLTIRKHVALQNGFFSEPSVGDRTNANILNANVKLPLHDKGHVISGKHISAVIYNRSYIMNVRYV